MLSVIDWKSEFIHWITLKPVIKDDVFTKTISFMKGKKLHNIEFPARIIIYKNSADFQLVYAQIGEDYTNKLTYSRIGKIFSIARYEDDELQSSYDATLEDCINPRNINGAAYIQYYENGIIQIKNYLWGGLRVPADQSHLIPYSIFFFENGNIRQMNYNFHYLDDLFYASYLKEFDYTSITYYESGSVKNKKCKINSKLQNITLPSSSKVIPACRSYYEDGTLRTEKYYLNDKLHNLDDSTTPAVIEYYPNGNIKIMRYYLNGIKNDRYDKHLPVYIEFYESGRKKKEIYRNLGKRLKIKEVLVYNEDGSLKY